MQPIAARNGTSSSSPPAPVLPFHPSPDVTLGVELELQIVDRDRGELVSGAERLLDACAQLGLDRVDREFLQCMVEVKTGVCRDTAEVGEHMFPLLRRLRAAAAGLGYELALGGTHPFSRS